MKDMKQWVALILTMTVCISIVVPVIASLFHVGEISETFRVKMFELVTFLVGVISGWLLGKGDKESPKS